MSDGRQDVSGPSFRTLAILFGAMYFLQGVSEPTAGLVAQPSKALLKSWGKDAAEISAFAAVLALPWSLKPIYGLLSDFLPIFGSRRRSYLMLTSALATLGFASLCVSPPSSGAVPWLLAALLLPTVSVAFNDVVVDALMVEEGQPRGITGRLQSIQWTAIYASQLLTGVVGGWISGSQRFFLGYAICGAAAFAMFVLAATVVRDPPRAPRPRGTWRESWPAVRQSALTLLCVASFLFLWSFNPFSDTVQYVYLTEVLGLSEEFYGFLLTLQAVGSIVACLAYTIYCRRVSLGTLLHLSIVMGIASTVCFMLLQGERSAIAVFLCFGFSYMTAMLVQLDLAARVCPPVVAGTVFACLMSVSNLGQSSSTAVGGALYESWLELLGATAAFHQLVGVGALCTAGCWLLVPFIRRTAHR